MILLHTFILQIIQNKYILWILILQTFIQMHLLVTGIDNVITYDIYKLGIWRV